MFFWGKNWRPFFSSFPSFPIPPKSISSLLRLPPRRLSPLFVSCRCWSWFWTARVCPSPSPFPCSPASPFDRFVSVSVRQKTRKQTFQFCQNVSILKMIKFRLARLREPSAHVDGSRAQKDKPQALGVVSMPTVDHSETSASSSFNYRDAKLSAGDCELVVIGGAVSRNAVVGVGYFIEWHVG